MAPAPLVRRIPRFASGYGGLGGRFKPAPIDHWSGAWIRPGSRSQSRSWPLKSSARGGSPGSVAPATLTSRSPPSRASAPHLVRRRRDRSGPLHHRRPRRPRDHPIPRPH